MSSCMTTIPKSFWKSVCCFVRLKLVKSDSFFQILLDPKTSKIYSVEYFQFVEIIITCYFGHREDPSQVNFLPYSNR